MAGSTKNVINVRYRGEFLGSVIVSPVSFDTPSISWHILPRAMIRVMPAFPALMRQMLALVQTIRQVSWSTDLVAHNILKVSPRARRSTTPTSARTHGSIHPSIKVSVPSVTWRRRPQFSV